MRQTIGILLTAALAAAGLTVAQTAAPPATQPAGAEPDAPPADNLEYWLRQAEPAETQPADIAEGRNPLAGASGPPRAGAVPGAVKLSDGTVLVGWLCTTVEKPWLVFEESSQRWRRVPFAAVLGIRAKVVDEEMALKWRWKEMGVPEKVYTGETYPTRRLEWVFHLADGTRLTGSVKGQPLWVYLPGGGREGPFVLHERMRGNVEQKLSDLVHVEHAVVSRRAMETIEPTTRPAEPADD
jgi:hypothetical protein